MTTLAEEAPAWISSHGGSNGNGAAKKRKGGSSVTFAAEPESAPTKTRKSSKKHSASAAHTEGLVVQEEEEEEHEQQQQPPPQNNATADDMDIDKMASFLIPSLRPGRKTSAAPAPAAHVDTMEVPEPPPHTPVVADIAPPSSSSSMIYDPLEEEAHTQHLEEGAGSDALLLDFDLPSTPNKSFPSGGQYVHQPVARPFPASTGYYGTSATEVAAAMNEEDDASPKANLYYVQGRVKAVCLASRPEQAMEKLTQEILLNTPSEEPEVKLGAYTPLCLEPTRLICISLCPEHEPSSQVQQYLMGGAGASPSGNGYSSPRQQERHEAVRRASRRSNNLAYFYVNDRFSCLVVARDEQEARELVDMDLSFQARPTSAEQPYVLHRLQANAPPVTLCNCK